jgi:hypothetical protein
VPGGPCLRSQAPVGVEGARSRAPSPVPKPATASSPLRWIGPSLVVRTGEAVHDEEAAPRRLRRPSQLQHPIERAPASVRIGRGNTDHEVLHAASMRYCAIQVNWRSTAFELWSEKRKTGRPASVTIGAPHSEPAGHSDVSGTRSKMGVVCIRLIVREPVHPASAWPSVPGHLNQPWKPTTNFCERVGVGGGGAAGAGLAANPRKAASTRARQPVAADHPEFQFQTAAKTDHQIAA